MQWYLKVLKQDTDFNGRARRTEFWMFVLFSAIASAILGLVDSLIGTARFIASGGYFYSPGVLGLIYGLAVLVPTIAVGVRRCTTPTGAAGGGCSGSSRSSVRSS